MGSMDSIIAAAMKTQANRAARLDTARTAPPCDSFDTVTDEDGTTRDVPCRSRATNLVQLSGGNAPLNVCPAHRRELAEQRDEDSPIKKIIPYKGTRSRGMRAEAERIAGSDTREDITSDPRNASIAPARTFTPTSHYCENHWQKGEDVAATHIAHFNPKDPDEDYMAPLCADCAHKANQRGGAAVDLHPIYTGSGTSKKINGTTDSLYNNWITRFGSTFDSPLKYGDKGVSVPKLNLLHMLDLRRSGSAPTSQERRFIESAPIPGGYGSDISSELFDSPSARKAIEDDASMVTKNRGEVTVLPRSPISPRNARRSVLGSNRSAVSDEGDTADRSELVTNINASDTEHLMGSERSGISTEDASITPLSAQRAFVHVPPPAGPHTHGEPYSVPNMTALADQYHRRHDIAQAALASDVEISGRPLNLGHDLTVEESRALHPRFWAARDALTRYEQSSRNDARPFLPRVSKSPELRGGDNPVLDIGRAVGALHQSQLMEHTSGFDPSTILTGNDQFVKNVPVSGRYIENSFEKVKEDRSKKAVGPVSATGMARLHEEGLGFQAPAERTCMACDREPSTHFVGIAGSGDPEDFHVCKRCVGKLRKKKAKGLAEEITGFTRIPTGQPEPKGDIFVPPGRADVASAQLQKNTGIEERQAAFDESRLQKTALEGTAHLDEY